MRQKISIPLLALSVILLTGLGSGAIVFNSSEYVGLNISSSEQARLDSTTLDLNDNTISDLSNIYQDDSSTNFFGSCPSGEVVQGINSDGSVNCGDADAVASVESLNKTLEKGNLANQSIVMDGNNIENVGGITMSDGFTSNDNYLQGSTASFSNLDDGSGAEIDVKSTIEMNANNIQSNDGSEFSISNLDTINDGFTVSGNIGLGGSNNIQNAEEIRGNTGTSADPLFTFDGDANTGVYSPGAGQVALTANGNRGMEVTSTGNVQVPSGYVNISSGDLEVSGQLTVGSTECTGTDKFIAGDGTCQDIGSTTDDQNLKEVLLEGNVANQSINMDGNGITNIKRLGLNNALPDDNITDSLTVSSSGNIDPDALNRMVNDGEVNNAITINASGTVDGDAIKSEIAGTELSYSSGTLNVDEGSGNGLNADQLDGVELSNIDWADVAMQQSDVDIADLDTATTDLDMGDNEVQNVISNSAGDAVNRSYVNDQTANVGLDDVLDDDNTVSSGGTNNINLNSQGNILNGAICPDGTCSNGNEYFESGGIHTTNIYSGSGSKITVKDNLEMSGNNLDGITNLRDTSDTSRITFDSSNNQVEIMNSDVGIGTSTPGEMLTVAGDTQIRGNLDVWGVITNTKVNQLKVNGSLTPPPDYSGDFDVGNSTNQWGDANFAGSVDANKFCADGDGNCDLQNYETFTGGGIGTTAIYDGSGGEIDIRSTVELNGNTIDEDDGTIDFGAGADFSGNIDMNGNSIVDSNDNDVNVNDDLTVQNTLEVVGGTECTGDKFIAGDGGCNSDDGSTVNKDLVAGSGLGGGQNNVLPGSDGDVSVSINAGSGLGTSSDNTVVNTGNAITVNTDSVEVADNSIDDEELVNNGIDDGDIGTNAVTQSGGELDSSVAGNGISYDSGELDAADNSANNEIQTLSAANDSISGASTAVHKIDISDTTNDAAVKDYYEKDTDNQGISDVLENSNTVDNDNTNDDIDMSGNDVKGVKAINYNSAGKITGGSGDICLGDRC